MPVRILAFEGTQGGRDLFLLPFGDPVAGCFDSGVVGAVQVPVAVPAPGTWLITGTVDRRTLLGRPPPLVLRPHPAGLLDVLTPLLRGGLLSGRCSLRGHRLLRGNGHAQVGVVLLPVTRLGLDTAPGRPAGRRAGLVITVIRISHPAAVRHHRGGRLPPDLTTAQQGRSYGK